MQNSVLIWVCFPHMELAKGAFYHIHTPYSSPSQYLSSSCFLSPLCIISLSPAFLFFLFPFHITSYDGEVTCSRLTEASLSLCHTHTVVALLTSLPFHHRGGGHPEGDEGEGGGDQRLACDLSLSHAQRFSSHRRHPVHPATAGHNL